MKVTDRGSRGRDQHSLAFYIGLASVIVAVLLTLKVRSVAPPAEPGPFWTGLSVVASDRESYTSLEEMAAASDSVVVATIERAEAGRVFGDHPAGHPDPDAGLVHYVSVTLRVGEVVHGSTLPPGAIVEFILPDPTLAPALGQQLPTDRAIYFLRSKELEARSLGLPLEIQQRELLYYRLVTTEALIRDLNGSARLVRPETPFLVALDGTPFETVAARIRRVP